MPGARHPDIIIWIRYQGTAPDEAWIAFGYAQLRLFVDLIDNPDC